MIVKMRIDCLVPDHILLRQGKYVQTCAHIERMLWYILFVAKGYNTANDEDVHAALSQRKVNVKLIKGLRDAIEAGEVAFPDQVTAILDEVERDIDNRHMAVHGSWTMRPDGTLNCEYFKNFGSNKKPQWQVYSAPISIEQIDEALIVVDRLLGETRKIFSAICDERGASRATIAESKSPN